MEQAGGQVVAITMGTPAQAARFREAMQLPFPCLSDAERRAYRAYGVPLASVAQIAGLEVWAPGLRALVRGGFGRPIGDVRQLQAAFLVDTSGTVRHAHRGRNSADVPDPQTLLAWLDLPSPDSPVA